MTTNSNPNKNQTPQPGQTYTGIIDSKMDYGVFVALPGKHKALVHFSELRGNRDALRRERMAQLKVGDKILVEIIPSKVAGKISASEKVVYNDIIMENLPVNEVLEGVISGLSEYGAFVVVEADEVASFMHVCSSAEATVKDKVYIAGLVHVSRLNCKRDEREGALKALKVGDKMKVLVTGMERDKNNEVVVALTQSDKPLEDIEIWDTIETVPE